MAAEALQHTGLALAHQVQRVAQVEARDRAARALEQAVGAAREHEGRPVQAVLQAAGDDADHAFVEAGVEQRQRGRRSRSPASAARSALGLLAHAGLDLAPLAVDGVELCRELGGACASSVSRHSMPSVMSDSRPAALMRGPSAKPKSKAPPRARQRPAALNSAATPGCMRPARMRLQALRDEAAVVGVELHHVGHGAERHQVEQRVEAGAALAASKRPRARSSARSASST